jgi:hypothetical protein
LTLSTLPATTRLVVLAAVVGLAPLAGTAAAQGGVAGRLAIEAVAATSTASRTPDDPFVFLDLTTAVRISNELDVIVRPYARRLPGGDWDLLFYQAQIRYQPTERVRLDAGIITSPLGLGTLELRQDLNPVVGAPFYYFQPLPVFDHYQDRVQVMSGGYPLGAMLSVSGARWDARTGVTDSTPARYRKIFANNSPSPAAQFVAGGGITPVPGLRIGAGLAVGRYRQSGDTDYYGLSAYTSPIQDQNALVFNLEAEYAVRYTRISGEWVRDRFNSTTTPAIAHGLYVQAVQTITPRIFAASRFTRATTPVQIANGRVRWARTVAEFTGGYRLTPELTVKAGYEVSRRFNVLDWNHAAVGSLVWGKRWF